MALLLRFSFFGNISEREREREKEKETERDRERQRDAPPNCLGMLRWDMCQELAIFEIMFYHLVVDAQIILTAAEQVAERVSHKTNSSTNSTIKQ